MDKFLKKLKNNTAATGALAFLAGSGLTLSIDIGGTSLAHWGEAAENIPVLVKRADECVEAVLALHSTLAVDEQDKEAAREAMEKSE